MYVQCRREVGRLGFWLGLSASLRATRNWEGRGGKSRGGGEAPPLIVHLLYRRGCNAQLYCTLQPPYNNNKSAFSALFSPPVFFRGGISSLLYVVPTALNRNEHYDALLALRFFPATFRKHFDACFAPFILGLFIMLHPSSGCCHAAIEQRLLDPSSSFNHDSQFLCPDRPSQVDNVPIVVGAHRLQSIVSSRIGQGQLDKKITSTAEAAKVGVVSSSFLS